MSLKSKIWGPIQDQLRQGSDPRGIARTCAAGVSLAVFPVLGATTALCVAVGIRFKLNQPILQAINYLLYPVQILLIPVFLLAWTHLLGGTPITFDPQAIAHEFMTEPRLFFANYGMAGLRAIAIWIIVAPLLFFLVERSLLPVLTRAIKAKHV